MKRELNIGAIALKSGKPLCIPYIGGWPSGPGAREVESHPGIAYFRSMDRCLATIAAWHKRHDRRINRPGTPSAGKPFAVSDTLRAEVASRLAAAQQVVSERPAKAMLAGYGVPAVAEELVQTAAEARDAAQAVGYPVALKVESTAILHKSEMGVVSIGLKNGQEVEEAFTKIMGKALVAVPRDQIAGVLVQPMVSGVEVVLGARMDPQFGPLVMVGLGGILVELLNDVAVGLAPIAHGEALAMLDGLKGRALLDGFRAFKPVDRHKLAEIVVNFSHFVDDHKDVIAEIDVNPLICAGDSIRAVDALIVPSKPAR
jgi:acetyl-CoA synthetase